MEFQIRHQRQLKDFQLNKDQEQLLKGLSNDGLHAWGNLYRNISGTMECDVDGEKMGLAKAATLLRQGDRPRREAAWRPSKLHGRFKRNQQLRS